MLKDLLQKQTASQYVVWATLQLWGAHTFPSK